jgi:hypothetical protein
MIDHGGILFESILDRVNALVTVTNREIGGNDGGIVAESDLSAGTDIPAIYQPDASSEVLAENGILVSDAVTFYLPNRWAGNTLNAAAIDRITHNSVVYQVLGTPVLEGGVDGWLRVTARVRT